MQSPDRFLAIDALRGLALVTIFINHVPGTIFERLTHKNFGLSDSAEIFVLLAGVGAALAYLRPFRAGDAARQIFRMVVRAVQIYAAHLVVLVVCGAIVAAAALSYHDPRILEAMNFETVASSPTESLLGIATLGLQPSYLNILPLYVVLLLMAPALIALVAHKPRLALLFSAGVYLAAQFGAVPPSYPQENAWFFNPFAWQLLFVIGLCAGAALVERRPIRRPGWVLPLCMAYLAAGLAWKQLEFYPEGVPGLPRFLWDDDKHLLSVPRLVHVLALAWVVTALPLERWLRRAPALAPLGWMGRNSLVVFSIGTILAIGGQVLRIIGAGDPSLDVAIIGLGLALQVGLAWALEWNRSGLKPQRVEAGAPVSAQR
ncbi:membrane protein [Alsobacter metallidurans]|uniref:Membrane protein n=1 Tax=Alsobacter metallidurans TaxID=340221 RepID=A0A917MID9_9HYPH|nr:OpgC domain-containing protein [Alsobacter metallidurans]GGH23681.1 membrane protein [Alsobacter metallidurans]